ncbi:MAG: hypothetical protein R6T83_11545 [Salinibacter sp.]
MRFRLSAALIALALVLTLPPEAVAQQSPRYGVGLQMLSTTVNDKNNLDVGPGVRFRVSAPINRDVSLGFGTSFTGFIFGGRDDAKYAFDPQASLIVTLPGSGEETFYVLGGPGVYLPFGKTDATSGPTFHLGAGKVWLLNESSFFFEVNPGLYVGSETTILLFPLRVGVIF